jgi:hypothetical protein
MYIYSFIGKWYILAPNEPGKILYTISFNDDGSVTGDTRNLLVMTMLFG